MLPMKPTQKPSLGRKREQVSEASDSNYQDEEGSTGLGRFAKWEFLVNSQKSERVENGGLQRTEEVKAAENAREATRSRSFTAKGTESWGWLGGRKNQALWLLRPRGSPSGCCAHP